MNAQQPSAQSSARIERWECPEHGANSGPGKRCGRMARPYVLCHREKVKVEYVRASDISNVLDADLISDGARINRIREALGV